MRSISCGGQPWSVESVMEEQTCGEIASIYFASTLVKRERFAFAQARHYSQMGVEEAFLSPSMKESIFSLVMPSKL